MVTPTPTPSYQSELQLYLVLQRANFLQYHQNFTEWDQLVEMNLSNGMKTPL